MERLSGDARIRREQRLREQEPADGPGWLALGQEARRRGRGAEAALAFWRACQLLGPTSAEARAGLDAVGLLRHGPWPRLGGSGAGRWSLLPGPRRGRVRWRVELPHEVQPDLLVGADNGVVLRGAAAGLLRVGPDGGPAERLGDWAGYLPPVLVDGQPRVFDRAALVERGPGEFASDTRLVPLIVGRGSRRYAILDQRDVLALDLGRVDPVWRVKIEAPADVVTPLSSWEQGDVLYVMCLEFAGGYPLLPRSVGQSAVSNLWLEARAAPDGALLWRSAREPGCTFHQGPSGAILAVGHDSTAAIRVRCLGEGGRVAWQLRREELPGYLGDLPLVALSERRALLPTRTGLLGLELEDGRLAWRREDLPGGIVVVDGEGWATFVSRQGEVLQLDPEGRTQFELRVAGLGPADMLALGDGVAYVVASSRRELLAIG